MVLLVNYENGKSRIYGLYHTLKIDFSFAQQKSAPAVRGNVSANASTEYQSGHSISAASKATPFKNSESGTSPKKY